MVAVVVGVTVRVVVMGVVAVTVAVAGAGAVGVAVRVVVMGVVMGVVAVTVRVAVAGAGAVGVGVGVERRVAMGVAEIPLREARSRGYLQELNRRVLHPLGVVLTLREVRNEAVGQAIRTEFGLEEAIVATFVDRRSAPEGSAFDFRGPPTAATKAASVAAEALEKRRERERLWGSSVQPIPDYLDAEPVTLADDDETVDLCLRLAMDAVETVVLKNEPPDGTDLDFFVADDMIEAVLLRVIGPLVQQLRLLPGGLLIARGEGSASPSHSAESSPEPEMDRAHMARARWLAKELGRLSGDHQVSGGRDAQGRPIWRSAPTELLGPEAEEARALAAIVQSWPLTEAPSGARVTSQRMDELFSLAQPGMRFWRGQRPDLTAAADIIHAKLDAYRAQRTERDRFLAGELAAHELADPVAVGAALEARAAPLREELAAVDGERAVIAGELAPIGDALTRLSVLREGTVGA